MSLTSPVLRLWQVTYIDGLPVCHSADLGMQHSCHTYISERGVPSSTHRSSSVALSAGVGSVGLESARASEALVTEDHFGGAETFPK